MLTNKWDLLLHREKLLGTSWRIVRGVKIEPIAS